MALTIERVEPTLKNDTWRLAARAFEKNDPDFFVKWGNASPFPDRDVQMIANLDGEIVAGLDIYYRQMAMPGCDLTVGCIANVFTLQQHRSRGYAGRLMEEAVDFMTENKYHVSILYGAAGFYERFGYGQVTLAEILLKGFSSGREFGYEFCDVDLDRDAGDLATIHKFSEDAGGVFRHAPETYTSWARMKIGYRGDKGGIRIVAHEGRPVAYYAWDERDCPNPVVNHPRFRTDVHITDFAAIDWAVVPSAHFIRLHCLKDLMKDPLFHWTPQLGAAFGRNPVRESPTRRMMLLPLDMGAICKAYGRDFSSASEYMEFIASHGIAAQDFDTF